MSVSARNYLELGIDLLIKSSIIIIALLTLSADAPPLELELGAPQTVLTNNPKMGVHTRLSDEVEAWKIKRTLEMVREMGSPWIVEYFPWAYAEPASGVFDWRHNDLVMNHARQQGLTVIARLGFVPEWARPTDSATSYLSPDHYADFGNYVYAFVKRYTKEGEDAPIIIIWNEPNLALEWGFQSIDSTDYAKLLTISYQRAKEANPKVTVLGGALAPTLSPIGNDQALNDLIYLQQMLDANAGQSMDGLAVHAYGWSLSADDPPDRQVINFRRVELVHQLLIDNGYAKLPIYITEGGWNDHPRWTRAVKPGQRIEYTRQASALVAQWPWVKMVAWWAFRYPWPTHTYLDYFTFVTPDFEPKPIYWEIQQMNVTR